MTAHLRLDRTTTGEPALAQSAAGSANLDRQEAAEALRRIEDQLETGSANRANLDRLTRDLSTEINRLREQMRDAATSAQRTETTMTAVERRLAELEDDAAEKRGTLNAKAADLAALTAALQRLARTPPSHVLTPGTSPLNTVRTGLLLESAIPRLNAEAEKLKAELARLADIEDEIRDQRSRLFSRRGS